MSVIDQKRIAKNTLLLYIRMGLIMLISLYTSRVVLDVLGAVDSGLYSSIGGIVISFSFLNGVMSSACNRYFAIEIGRADYDALHRVFCLNVTIFLGIGVVILILSESLGLWFVNSKMVFPAERAVAVNWVYQLSVISFILTMISTPYRSIIIAKEKMKVFAYSSVVEAILKLAIVFLLVAAPFDRLIYFALLMLVVTGGVSAFYIIYCVHFYKECRYDFYWDKALFKEILGYTGWNVIGVASGIGKTQGVNILLNMFFGPLANAAYYASSKVYGTINQFVSNFCTAFNPQITKSYSAGEHAEMMKLVFQSSKFSYYLLFLLVLPLCLETPAILDLWLKDVPAHAVSFTRLMLIAAVIDSISYPFVTAIQATGRVKWYQICVGGSMLMVLPVTYILFKFGHFNQESAFVVIIIASVVAQILRIWFMHRQLHMDVRVYFRLVIWPTFITSVLSAIVPLLVVWRFEQTLWRTLFVVIICILLTGVIVYSVGLTATERKHTNEIIFKYLKHRR